MTYSLLQKVQKVTSRTKTSWETGVKLQYLIFLFICLVNNRPINSWTNWPAQTLTWTPRRVNEQWRRSHEHHRASTKTWKLSNTSHLFRADSTLLIGFQSFCQYRPYLDVLRVLMSEVHNVCVLMQDMRVCPTQLTDTSARDQVGQGVSTRPSCDVTVTFSPARNHSVRIPSAHPQITSVFRQFNHRAQSIVIVLNFSSYGAY